jgi:hypothetical protein
MKPEDIRVLIAQEPIRVTTLETIQELIEVTTIQVQAPADNNP